MLPVRDIAGAIHFYRDILGMTLDQFNHDLGWAALNAEGVQLMLSVAINKNPSLTRDGVIYLYPDNLDELHRQIVRFGYPVSEICVTEYGMREFKMRDPDGNAIWIGERAEAATS